MLTDKFDRSIDYLRVSITDRCNLNCIYCNPNRLSPKLTHQEILSYEEILRLVRVGVESGVTKVRVTGGEPLVRKGVYEFLKKLTAIEGLSDVSLTTNGVLVKENIEKLKDAGIHRINISLDTLKPEKYRRITGRDCYGAVRDGIDCALKAGLMPVKLNVVALKGVNDDEIPDFAELSVTSPLYVRFIEYMTIGDADIGTSDTLLTPEIKDRIRHLGELTPVEKDVHDGPAAYFRLKGAKGRIGFITAMSNHFCHTCNRIRLTSSGKLRPCLLSDREVDIKGPLRKGCPDRILGEIFKKAVKGKPKGHEMTDHGTERIATRMCAIGG